MRLGKNIKILFFILVALGLFFVSMYLFFNPNINTNAGSFSLTVKVSSGKGSVSASAYAKQWGTNNIFGNTSTSASNSNNGSLYIDNPSWTHWADVTCSYSANFSTGYHFTSFSLSPTSSTDGTGISFNGSVSSGSFTIGISNGNWNSYTGTLSANFSANTYTVVFNGNGSTSGSMSNQTFTYDQSKSLSSNRFEKKGYTFAGWATSSSGSVVYSNNQSVKNLTSTNNGRVYLYAKWTANSYTLTANANGGSISSTSGWSGTGTTSTKSVKYDSTYGTLPTPTRTGYTFDGWYDASSGGNKVTSSTKMTTLGETIYAHWTANGYTLIANANGGSISSTSGWTGTGTTSTKTVKYNSTYGTLPTPTRTGYTFNNWWTSPSGGSRVYTTTKMNSTSGATIYAHWIPNIYKITLDKQSGSGGTNEIYLKYNTAWCSNSSGTSTITSITKPTRTGYTFGGYYTDKNGTGTQIINASGSITGSKTYIASADTLYAKWTANTYSIVFDKNGGSGSMSNQSMTYDKASNLTTNTYTRQGYYFVGWSKTKLGVQSTIPTSNIYKDEESVKNLVASGSITLYAVWLDTWANHTTTPTGSGSSVSPYIIDSAEDLAWMINNHGSALKYFKQTKAINLSKYNWYPIGTSDKPFKGVYDGQGYEITNLNILEITNASGNKIQSDIGLFGYTSGGEITGIYIKNATIYGKDNVGLIVSNATSTKINSNIIESSTINASGNYGAVAGKISGGEIKYNLVYVTTNGGTSTSSLYTGSTTLSTNLVENNGTRSKVGTEDLTGWGKVFNRLLPSAISWGAKVTPATSSDLTNWVDKKID